MRGVTSIGVQLEATTADPLRTGADTIAVGVFEGEDVAHDVDEGALARLLEAGEAKPTFKHLAITHAGDRRFVLVGLGPREQFDHERARVAAALAYGRAKEVGAQTLCWEVPHHVEDAVVGGLVEGTLLRAYRFARYKPDAAANGPDRLLISAHHDVETPVRRAEIVTGAQNRARDLGNAAANDMTPALLAAYAQALPGVRVSVLDEHQIRDAGMGAFSAVARGSREGARLIVLEYDGTGGGGPLTAFVGKAVTFDSGGISIKPAAKMHEMKFDMAGGAAVIEAIGALVELRAPVRVLGVVGAAENLPSASAMKPGDVVRALDGTTIEINNTDAEGRLILADCLTHARRLGAERMIDVATLTGGIVTALGSVYAGLMANDDALAERVARCGERTGELLWRLPLHPRYAELVKGRYAQLTNTTERRGASPITGAEFLHHFAGETPWAHLDIAGTAFEAPRAYLDKGATGFGVRLLVELAFELSG